MLYTAIFLALVAQQQQQTAAQSTANPPVIAGSVDTPTDSTGLPSALVSKAVDARFARNVAMSGMMQVRLGRLGEDKTSNEEVKTFCHRMVVDHSNADDELQSVAAKNKIKLPTDIDAKHQAMIDRLSGLSGMEFDAAYVNMMVKFHDQNVSEFQQEASNGTNEDLKTFAATALPVVQAHDRKIREIKKNMGGKMKTPAGSGSN